MVSIIMARLSKSDWLAEGFTILSEFAQNKLRILYLCERLGVTRGSFYHHFDGIEDYVDALMAQWKKEHTEELIDLSNQHHSPLDQLQALNGLVAQKDQSIEAAIRSWSFYQPLVRKHLAKVDEMRMAYLANLYQGLGAEKEVAIDMAKVEYATLIGLQQLYPKLDAEGFDRLYEAFRSLAKLMNQSR